MAEPQEPRALTAALASPAFVPHGGGRALHAANRHVERWAPEASAAKVRPLRNLGFVDRLVAPWLETARRSASLRVFSQYIASGPAERAGGAVSWVFPRPWYQDELDWMAAAREIGEHSQGAQQAPTMLTTRGTFVAPAQSRAPIAAMPAAVYEYVAPSLSLARPDAAAELRAGQAYSPLVPFAAANAAQVMARVVAPLARTGEAPRMSAGLRAVLATMLDRAAAPGAGEAPVTRLAGLAPTLVTPPAPRPDAPATAEDQVLHEAGEQRARIAELQRVARAIAERELAARTPAATPVAPVTPAAPAAPTAPAATRAAATDAGERARIEARIAERLAEREARVQAAQRLHDQARDAAARDAREQVAREATAAQAARDAAARAPETARASEDARAAAEARLPAELAAAIAALPPELATAIATGIGRRPERAVHAIRELDDALRAVELIARTSASGQALLETRGPRLVMPAGLGGLVAALDAPVARVAERGPAIGERTAARAAAPAPRAVVAAPWTAVWPVAPAASRSALGAAEASRPAALQHVAWADRWLARFAGASPRTLDTLDVAAAPAETRLAALASAAPGAVFVAPRFDAAAARDGVPAAELDLARAATAPAMRPLAAAPASSLVRIDDDAETPDDLLVAISAAATRARAPAAPASTPRPAEPTFDVAGAPARETLADLVAQHAPAAPGAGFAAQLASSPFAPALRHVLALPAAPSFDVRALLGSGLVASYLSGLVQASGFRLQASGPESEPSTVRALDWSPSYVSPAASDDPAALADAGSQTADAAPITLRSTLLSWDVETAAGSAAPQVAATGAPIARTLVESLALPMLGERAAVREPAGTAELAGAQVQVGSFAAPGMIADRAHAWSVAQERSTSDLALDFVAPELVLAARVYGFGPAEAAQAMRLAIAGPGQLAAMASAVDRTFVQVMRLEAERRAAGGEAPRARAAAGEGAAVPAALTTAYPLPGGDIAAVARPAAGASPSMFGVERRAPRGAFLWPSATVGALGLQAPAPDGDLSSSVAALELLAAQAVAEMGSYASALDGVPGALAASASAASAGSATSAAAPLGDSEVLEAAAAQVPASRRAKFEALYLALGQAPGGRDASLAARAARAIALAGRGGDAITARERASIAWDVLPVVYATPEAQLEGLSTGAAAARRAELRELYAGDARPGLGRLSSRAGEALGSYVAPTSAEKPAAATSHAREAGAMLRAPTAAPELVRTGRPSGRHGGGEVEIPPWFEAAARRMFEERTGSEGMSLAELTLVTAAPSTQIAASSRAAPSAVPPTPAPGAKSATQQPAQIDIEKLANEVYRQVLILMEAARARNGEPYL